MQKKPDEKTAWEKATAVEDTAARVAALQKFNEAFPKSSKRNDALVLIATARVALGNEKLTAGDIDAAAVLFKAAAADAPKPIPDKLWTDMISTLPTSLFFRGARTQAFEIAKILEEKADANAAQLLGIAAFYMSVEDGTEMKRLVEKAIIIEPNSSAAYQSLGLANRLDFQLDDSAAAYAKALELEPDSLAARRGLAEMKRSLGKPAEAVTLYREILTKDGADRSAQTGFILALFDAEKRADAESELAKSLDANPGNVILLASAAYWYASHNEADKAVDLAQKSIAADPRFIWSHIALARGLVAQKKPADSEKVLLAARQYGNFPALEYEIASARLAAGYYREAAEELTKSFSVKDGAVQTKLGGRVPRESKNILELVGFERRASIFAPTAADDPENAARLTALLVLKQELDAVEPKGEAAAKAADDFVRGDDKMTVHRQIYAASLLLDKKIALPKVLEFAKAAAANVEAGLDIPNASVAVMASELYENRAIAAARGEYIIVPDVPRPTLSAILRGRIEDLNGWARYQMDDPAEAVVRLKRAVGVLPVDSAWWKTAEWRLGSALVGTGKDAEALDAYIKVYKSGSPDTIRYNVIESLYKKVNGKVDGLEAQIGPNPAPSAAVEPAVQKVDPVPSATPELRAEPTPKPEEVKPAIVPDVTPTPSPSPEAPKAVDEKDLFPPVVIKVPSSDTKPETTPAIKPCTVTSSEESLTLESGGGDLAVIVGLEGDGELDGLKAVSSSPTDVAIRREVIAGVKARALFVVRSASKKAGTYQVSFELPCDKKVVVVIVR